MSSSIFLTSPLNVLPAFADDGRVVVTGGDLVHERCADPASAEGDS